MSKKLYKSKDNVKISGVCAGLGQYLEIDPTIVRVLWVIGSLVTGFIIGFIVYIACSLIIPVEPDYFDAEYKEK